MGFLDHSTNNIIIDAVLTDRGRELLAKNNGSFQIMHYAFGDDEVDYTLIKKFGRTVGKEKVEKNTPVFEAQTSSILGLKYPLTKLSSPSLTALPILALPSNTTIGQVTTTTTQEITVNQQATSSNITAAQRQGLGESNYKVSIDSRFLSIQGSSTFVIVPNSSIQVHDLSATSTSTTADILSKISFTLAAVEDPGKSLTQFHTGPTTGLVKTFIKVQGVSTGASLNIEITVNYNS